MATVYNDTLVGNVYDNYLNGGLGNDVLIGGKGSDILVGSYGNDQLVGFGGNAYEYDAFFGGYGADYFWLGDPQYGDYYLGIGHAIIHDFSRKDGDKIVVSDNPNDYTLVKTANVIGTATLDTAIYKGSSLIGVVKDNPNVVAADFVSV